MHQITVQVYRVREVSRRSGVSTHSLNKWMKLFGETASKADIIDHEVENRRLKRELARVIDITHIKTHEAGCIAVSSSTCSCAVWLVRPVSRMIADLALQALFPLVTLLRNALPGNG